VVRLQAGGEGGFGPLGELELLEGAVDQLFVAAGAAVLEADAEGSAVGGQGGEGVAPALGLGEAFTQFAFIGDFDACLFQGVQKFFEGLVAQTSHLSLH
jgi:hypothetical protein